MRPTGEIACEFIEAHGKAARFGADKVDFHDDRHRPGEALIDAEQRVGGDDPAPARRPDDHEWDRQPDEPAEHEHMLAALDIGKMSGDQIGDGLDDAEADDEGEHGRRRGDLEFLRADQRHDRPFDPTMPPTKALMRTSSENCCQLARSPRTTPGADGLETVPLIRRPPSCRN